MSTAMAVRPIAAQSPRAKSPRPTAESPRASLKRQRSCTPSEQSSRARDSCDTPARSSRERSTPDTSLEPARRQDRDEAAAAESGKAKESRLREAAWASQKRKKPVEASPPSASEQTTLGRTQEWVEDVRGGGTGPGEQASRPDLVTIGTHS